MSRKKPEQHSERYLTGVIRTMNDGLLVVSPEGRILMVNPALERLTGYSAEELTGAPCTILRCDACKLARSQGRGKWCQLFSTGQETRRKCGLVTKDGAYLPILKNASLLKDGETVLGSVETVTDISELDRKERRIEELARQIRQEHDEDDFHGMVGRSPVMRRTFELIEKAALSEAPILILGESGTGKELVARAIHELGPRREGPFIGLNCAALSEGLLESELFGHVKGAFTGAYRHRQGRFEAAHGGDIFLDEIGDVPPSIQVKLLRVLETKSFERVGDHVAVEADVRLIAATNRDLRRLVAQGGFREDFFFRINVIPISLPPLRERREDIPLLVERFLRAHQKKWPERGMEALSPEAMRLFMEYGWPGNVRELRSALEYAFVISHGPVILPEHLPPHLLHRAPTPPPDRLPAPLAADSARSPSLDRRDESEREALVRALKAAGGNKSEAARLLGVSRLTVHNRMRKHGVELTRDVRG